jgi:pimeloyl-ACP methyl ester carboxylesterase
MPEVWLSTQKAAAQAQLDQLASSPVFSGAPRLVKFLRYVVDAQLNGEGGELNQMRIAVDVMGRGGDFDPALDSLVRVEVGRLRSKLREYYATDGQDDPVRFALPKGRYSPDVSFAEARTQAAPTGDARGQSIRFLRMPDRTSIAYSICGAGYPVLKAANWFSHLEFDLISPVWSQWWLELSRRYQLIRYDERGSGMSDWDVDDFSVEAWVDDLEQVANAVGPGKFALLGISQGAAVAIAYAVRRPERVSHLILYGGCIRGMAKRAQGPEEIEQLKVLRELMRVGWGQNLPAFRKIFASLFAPEATREQVEAFDVLQSVSTSPQNAVRFFDAFGEIDVVDLASQVSVPTLVLHSRHDMMVPMTQGRLMASTIPGAKLVSLESTNHILSETEPAWQIFLDEVDRFLEQ